MAGFLDKFREKILVNVSKVTKDQPSQENVPLNDKIALGVLLWVVAEADNQFLPEEEEKIQEVLIQKSHIDRADLPFIMESIKVAAEERIDLHTFTHEVSKDLTRKIKIEILESLFRVACIDNELAQKEQETIRKIADLFRLDHKEFIDTKIKIKKEFGMDTAGF